ncbi:MAG: UDP-N-acetylglucosamine--N-acetylmuramyl-(pentapeptide) pyrophosphoryl-undecaprenol N-acetylglucosamine transferase, partial [Clostridia bacterium]|nr:UDP-N-acetylglucosamine--N-acetylmuramyl-(pentapeptide) pyrophosphoryl-undecaprenol N-acetylglucosamine transferase [Clostridia bacterium]
DIGAAVLLEESELTGEVLYATLCDLVFDKGRLCDMQRAAKTLAHPLATSRICDEIEGLVK